MRVIAGKYRSRQLRTPGFLGIRPTSDRLRETLFNILGPSVTDALFVDLYAGTGAIGIEALSRGAREVFFIDRDRLHHPRPPESRIPGNFRWSRSNHRRRRARSR